MPDASVYHCNSAHITYGNINLILLADRWFALT